jgi:hypothetical protein
MVIQLQPAPLDVAACCTRGGCTTKADRLHEPHFGRQPEAAGEMATAMEVAMAMAMAMAMIVRYAARNEESGFLSHWRHEREMWGVMAQWKFRSGRRKLNCRTEGMEPHD